MADPVPVDYRVTWLTGMPVLLLAAGLDVTMILLSIPAVTEVVSEMEGIVGDGLIPTIFRYGYRMDFKRDPGKKYGPALATGVLKLVPFINDVPAFSMEAAYFIKTMRAEDRKDAQERAAALAKSEEDRAKQLQARMQAEQAARAANDNQAQEERVAA